MDFFFQLLLNGLGAGALYALVAVGFNLIYGATKFFNLTHGAMIAIGGYAVYHLTDRYDANLYLAALAGVLIAGVCGYGVDKVVYLPLRHRQASNMVLLVASLGALTVIQAGLAISYTSQFRPLSTDVGGRVVYSLFGTVVVSRIQLMIFLFAIAIAVVLALLLRLTRFGKAVKAVSDDHEVAAISGIDTNRLMGYVFFIGSAIAGLAGILVGLDTGIDPTMGLALLLKGVIAAIVGGIGSLPGAVLGAFMLGLIENFGIWVVPGIWKDAIAFGLLIVFLLIRPRGLLGRR
jgi:branched-chain amino acid transport system permease protein